MSQDQLRMRLEAIYLELDTIAPDEADRLLAVREELGDVLAEMPDVEEAEYNLSDQLRQLVTRFETEHPRLAHTMEEVVDSLSRMGI